MKTSKKVMVGVMMSEDEIEAFRSITRINKNATALLTLARIGAEVKNEGVGICSVGAK